MKIRFLRSMRNALVIVIVCLSVSLLYDVYKEPIDRLLHLDQTETNETTETGNRKQKTKKQAQKPDGQQEEGLPSAYDGRMTGKAPEVKNQGTVGTCWAVVTSSALESRLLPQEDIIFSADHISTQNSYAIGQEEGGAYNIAIAYLTAWQGPVTEEMDPYGDGVTPEGLSPVKHVQEVQIAEDKDFDAIKEMIYRYGAVQSSIYMDMGGTKVTSEYYDPENTSYYYNGEDEVNHDILIIGWDDDYPAENFTKTPSKNGAFLCQNSWGEGFGDGGRFYVAYDDTQIGRNCVAYTRIDGTDNYDHLYQTDLCGWVGNMGYKKESCWFANVYTADSTQTLRAVGFYATGSESDYEIYVAADFKNEMSLVLPKKIQKGHLERKGFYTIDLKKEISIAEGERFAVMVKINTPGSDYPVAMEYRADDQTANVNLEDGCGYVSVDGYRWSRIEEEYGGNICLKAYTDNR